MFKIWIEGDHRERSGFLVFPKIINGEKRWWKTARWFEQRAILSNPKASYFDFRPVCWL